MTSSDQFNWLKKEVEDLLKHYKADRDRHKNLALWLKILSVLLAAIVTILLGLQVDENIETLLKNIALMMGATITVINAYEAFFDPRALWVKETSVYVRLKDLKRDMEFYRMGRDDQAVRETDIAKFKERLTDILADSLQEWLKIRGAGTPVKNDKED